MDLDPALLPAAERYKLLIGGVVPRPIAWVSTLDAQGTPNLAPFSFFAGVGAEPMTLLFCPANLPSGEPKDTLRNLLREGSGEQPPAPAQFVVSSVPHALRRPMAACAEPLPYGHSEFVAAGLTPAPSVKVRPPRVAGSPLAWECVVHQIIRLTQDAPGGANIVIGRVVHIHAVDGLINERRHVDPALLDSIGRMGGTGYCTTRDRFDLPMGLAALQA